MNFSISVPMDRLAEYCRANGIARLAVFGSALRADFGPESDIDLLVDFEPGRTLSLFDMAGMEQEFSEIFGRKQIWSNVSPSNKAVIISVAPRSLSQRR